MGLGLTQQMFYSVQTMDFKIFIYVFPLFLKFVSFSFSILFSKGVYVKSLWLVHLALLANCNFSFCVKYVEMAGIVCVGDIGTCKSNQEHILTTKT